MRIPAPAARPAVTRARVQRTHSPSATPRLPGTGFADNLKHKLEVLRSHCDDAGRDYGAIEKTVSTFVDPDADRARVLAHLADLADLGIDHAMVSPRRPWDETTLDQVAAIVPDVYAIPVGG